MNGKKHEIVQILFHHQLIPHTHPEKVKFYLAPHVPKTVDIDILPSSLK